jgi:hypothetical protein
MDENGIVRVKVDDELIGLIQTISLEASADGEVNVEMTFPDTPAARKYAAKVDKIPRVKAMLILPYRPSP